MTHASLFSGIGGFDLAAEWAGWTNAFNCEIDPFVEKSSNTIFQMQNNTETYEQQTLPFGETASTCSQAVSPASRSVSQASARARRTTATSGRKCCGLFGLFDPAGSLAKTFTELLTGRKEWSSTRCVLTWKRQDTKCSRTLYRACGVGAPHRRDRCWFVAHRTDAGIETMREGQDGVHAVGVAADADCNRCRIGAYQPESVSGSCRPTIALAARIGLLPMPTANDATNSSLPASQVKCKSGLPRMVMQSDEYQAGTTSRLNPRYVIEMMGFPASWLISPFLRGGENPSKHAATP